MSHSRGGKNRLRGALHGIQKLLEMLFHNGHAFLADFKAVLLALLISIPISLLFQFLSLPFRIQQKLLNGCLDIDGWRRLAEGGAGPSHAIGDAGWGPPLLLQFRKFKGGSRRAGGGDDASHPIDDAGWGPPLLLQFRKTEGGKRFRLIGRCSDDLRQGDLHLRRRP